MYSMYLPSQDMHKLGKGRYYMYVSIYAYTIGGICLCSTSTSDQHVSIT